jgi:N-acyl-D-amino-acid deacylase
MRGVDEIDCLCDLLVSERGRAGMILFSMSEEDVAQVISLPYSMIASDTIHPPAGLPHPRMYGTFPKVLRKYVRETGLLSLPKAVRKMTALPAARVGLRQRGLIRQGNIADLVLFHPEDVADKATYADPAQAAQGIDMVWIGGRVAVNREAIQPQKHGCFMEREGTP